MVWWAVGPWGAWAGDRPGHVASDNSTTMMGGVGENCHSCFGFGAEAGVIGMSTDETEEGIKKVMD